MQTHRILKPMIKSFFIGVLSVWICYADDFLAREGCRCCLVHHQAIDVSVKAHNIKNN